MEPSDPIVLGINPTSALRAAMDGLAKARADGLTGLGGVRIEVAPVSGPAGDGTRITIKGLGAEQASKLWESHVGEAVRRAAS